MKRNPLSNQNSKQLHETQKNLREQVTIGFGFTSDWLKKWREGFFKPITQRSNAKPKYTQITFDTQVKIALWVCSISHLESSFLTAQV